MAEVLLTTTGELLTGAGGAVIKSDPVFPALSPALEFTRTAIGLLDGVQNRLVQPSDNCRVWSVTVGSVEYFVDWTVGYVDVPFTFNNCDYTLNVGEWGLCSLTHDPADVGNLPADDTTATIATITSYKLAFHKANILSTAYGSVDVKLNGLSTGGGSDTVPPTVAGMTPSGFSVTKDQDTIWSCSENVQVGTGNYYKHNATTGNLIETVAAASASYVGTTITIPWSNAESDATAYTISCDAGTFEDGAGNGCAAIAQGTWTYITASSGGGGVNADTDVTVSSIVALRSQLQSWEDNWNTTTPAGKTNSDDRVIGITSSTTGAMDLSNLVFPQRVYVRHVGTFSGDSIGVASCSVNHSGTGTINNSTNVWLYLMDLRAPDNANYNSGLWQSNGSTDCGIVRCSARGWPFVLDTSATGTTGYVFTSTGSTRFTYMQNAGFYFRDGHWKLFNTHTNFTNVSNIGNFFCGDDYTFATGISFVDPIWHSNFYARRRMMADGIHNDGIQFNQSPSTTPAIRFNMKYDVYLRGRWGGAALTQVGEGGWGAAFTSGAVGTCIGPHLHEHMLLINGHVRAVTGFPGGNGIANYCTAIQHDNDQPPNAAWPAVRGVSAATGNFCSGPNSSFNTIIGTNGFLLVLGGNNQGVGANFNLLLPYFTTIPTNYTDLWDIRPPVGAATHPNFGGNKIGCWQLWEKLFNGDSDVVLSKIGWPVAPTFISDFDRNDNFWGSYTGTFDANGDNA